MHRSDNTQTLSELQPAELDLELLELASAHRGIIIKFTGVGGKKGQKGMGGGEQGEADSPRTILVVPSACGGAS